MDKPMQHPTDEQWRLLYDAANRLKAAAPWDFMRNDDIFGVKNPADGEIAYCVVLGSGDEVYALVAYLGTDGLGVLHDILDGELVPGDYELIYRQACLMASFDDRDMLSPEELAQIKKLGLRYRGRSSWPHFVNYATGKLPWFFSQADAVFMTQVIDQALIVAERFRQTPTLVATAQDDTYLVRTMNPDGEWRDEWLTPKPPARIEERPVALDELRIERIRKNAEPKDLRWEADVFYCPIVLEDRERPYHPRMAMIADSDSGFVMQPDFLNPDIPETQAFVDFVLNTIEQTKFCPTGMILADEVLLRALIPVGLRMGFRVELVDPDDLEAIDEARLDLFEHLTNEAFDEQF